MRRRSCSPTAACPGWLRALLIVPARALPSPLLCRVPCPPQINKYQPNTGRGSCLQCGAGTSTQGEGNTECQPCPLGYYSPSGDSECLPAPAGSYVGAIGSTTFTPW